MTRCIIIGAVEKANETAKLLSTSGVVTKALSVTGKEEESLVKACLNEHDLYVVAVFCRDFKDRAIPFLKNLRKQLPNKANIHIFREGGRDAEPGIRELTAIGASEVFINMIIQPISAATSIKKRWFPAQSNDRDNGKRQTHDSSSYYSRTGGRAIVTSAVKVAKQGVALASLPSEQATSGMHSTLETSELEKAKIAQVSTMENQSPNSSLLGLTEKNRLLLPQSEKKCLVGLHGQSIQIDPRRVRPLPGQPRDRDNEGFTEESLRGLGESIKTAGQTTDAWVCPIENDLDYDAQLIDGERRHLATKMAGLYLKVRVREDITAVDVRKLYLLSVVGNAHRVEHTTREKIKMVSILNGPDYRLTPKEITEVTGIQQNTIYRFLQLLKGLDPDVVSMIDRGLTVALAHLLLDVPLGKQLLFAMEIADIGMNTDQARRYLLQKRREEGVSEKNTKRGQPSNQFATLLTLTSRSLEQFGVYTDMPKEQVLEMLRKKRPDERKDILTKLQAMRDSVDFLVILATAAQGKETK